ncbi:integrase core domain protein [Ceratobasidium sp. AG-Ba]|nr:integrase core domain protein [Ceratobasidium sp. AG-Ba]
MSGSTQTLVAGSLHRIAPLRGSDNYNMWRVQMEDILTDLDLYGYVDLSNPLPDDKSSDYDKKLDLWAKLDRKALSNIRLRVDGSVLTHIQGCKTSADAWNTLASTFQIKGTVGLIDLRRKLFSHRMAELEEIEEHIQRMREWFEQINLIAPGSLTEVDWITTLVASLPDSWDAFTQSISFDFTTDDANKLANEVSDLRSRILAEAHRRNARSIDAIAYVSTSKTSQKRTGQTNDQTRVKDKDKTSSKCKNCGKIGHWAAECWSPGGGAYRHEDNDYESDQDEGSDQDTPNRKFSLKGEFRVDNGRLNITDWDGSDEAEAANYAF